MTQESEHTIVTLVCGTCGHKTNIASERWVRFLKTRTSPATVMLCEKPSTIRGAKQGRKCLGVLTEISEAFWYGAEKE